MPREALFSIDKLLFVLIADVSNLFLACISIRYNLDFLQGEEVSLLRWDSRGLKIQSRTFRHAKNHSATQPQSSPQY